MTRSGPPSGEQPAGPAAQPYQPGPYPPQPYPSAPGPAGTAGSSPSGYEARGDFGQPPTGSDTSTVALPTGQAEYLPPVAAGAAPQQQSSAKPSRRPTRIGAAWVALIVAAIVLIFLLIFIVQNSGPVQIRYFGFEGTIPLGVAMLFAAIAGALTAALLGTVKILQLRKKNRQALAGK